MGTRYFPRLGGMQKIHGNLILRGGQNPNEEEQIVKLRNIVATIKESGDFSVAGKANFTCLPGLEVRGVGLLPMPFSEAAADNLRGIATRAPFGKRNRTITDISVRNTWQVDEKDVSISNPFWIEELNSLVQYVTDKMGLEIHNVYASLYKLLLYEKGGHFKEHKDTQKRPGMFGTLVVQFPSHFVGGAFTVSHCGVSHTYDSGAIDGSAAHCYYFIAHYADCPHEIAEITAGRRLVAVCSLCWRGEAGALPKPPSLDAPRQLATALLLVNSTLAVLLQHEYCDGSLARLGLGALKGRDRQLAAVLTTVSSLLTAEDPDEALLLYIARAIRERDSDEMQQARGSRWQHARLPTALDYYSDVYDASGRILSRREAQVALEPLNCCSNILNYAINIKGPAKGNWDCAGPSIRGDSEAEVDLKSEDWSSLGAEKDEDGKMEAEEEEEEEKEEEEEEESGEGWGKDVEKSDSQEVPPKRHWWRRNRVQQGYLGNEGGAEQYHFFVLAFCRASVLRHCLSLAEEQRKST